MIRYTTRWVVMWFVAFAACELTQADVTTLSNSHYTLCWNDTSQQISIHARKVPQCHVSRLSVVGKVTALTTEKIDVPQLGTGECWNLQLEGNIAVSVVLFDKLPFVGVRKSIRNRADAVRTIDKLPVVEATLDFE